MSLKSRRLAADLEDAFSSLRAEDETRGQIHSEIEENALLLLSPLADLGEMLRCENPQSTF